MTENGMVTAWLRFIAMKLATKEVYENKFGEI